MSNKCEEFVRKSHEGSNWLVAHLSGETQQAAGVTPEDLAECSEYLDSPEGQKFVNDFLNEHPELQSRIRPKEESSSGLWWLLGGACVLAAVWLSRKR